ncbi:NmrA/HSCARG family protein [Solitalea koreensis]|uniref:Uncharacterized conserved protein YbjT, contains NAD(P)-binding and DUF2867 domains n=1 Tax=Solitalea koreensis TaxID=543615 RepID=A0A521BYV0_9SPHI|nr:NmrA/HSCARG family protein [Solitalea koreensis]SMO52369.1 Uncharacterized conserved protein YbjT, contains NAD(P)-binding and DUF2867 domains [Solitalea koreensis]
MSDQTILVIGATGAQGGSVARHLLKDNRFKVRCFTRNEHSEKALALKAAGAELAVGDLDDKESLFKAMKDCYGVFGLTITKFDEHFDNEYQQGKNLIDAVFQSHIQHFVFSALPYAKKLSNEQYAVPHFDTKAQLEEYARELMPNTTFVHVAFYYENFLNFFHPKKGEDGNYHFGFPQGDTKLSGVSVEDAGGVINVIFNRPDEFKGKVVGIVGDDITPDEYAEVMSAGFDKHVKYSHILKEVFAGTDFHGALDIANMFEFTRNYIKNRQADLELSRSLYPQIKSFKTWLEENKGRFFS